jgi:hypothetical protein
VRAPLSVQTQGHFLRAYHFFEWNAADGSWLMAFLAYNLSSEAFLGLDPY